MHINRLHQFHKKSSFYSHLPFEKGLVFGEIMRFGLEW